MNRLPPLGIAAILATLGAIGTLALGLGPLSDKEMEHLLVMLPIAIIATLAATALVLPTLRRASLRVRLVGIALFATAISLANLIALSALMLVSEHDAIQVAILFIYSAAAGSGAAIATARASSDAVERLDQTARRLAEGDLSARAGDVDGGPELDALATTLDDMAMRLDASLVRERQIESQRQDLITAVSHDLRTPLAGLRAMIEAIEDGVVEDPITIRRYVGEMRGAVNSLVSLVDDLFELVQLDAGAIEAEVERARLTDVVTAAIAACDAQAAEKGLVLELSLSDAEGALTSPRLTRVVQNLLTNAIRHTPADGTISIEARRAGNDLELAVRDSGEGISPDAAPHVFEPFWRGDVARASEGTGLGLALAKRITEALGGTISVESEPARGSRFSVLVPQAMPKGS